PRRPRLARSSARRRPASAPPSVWPEQQSATAPSRRRPRAGPRQPRSRRDRERARDRDARDADGSFFSPYQSCARSDAQDPAPAGADDRAPVGDEQAPASIGEQGGWIA